VLAMETFARSLIGAKCMAFTQTLISHPLSSMFRKPVTDESYLQFIRNPVDLETIRKKLKDGAYFSEREWLADIDLMFDNCTRYNGAGSAPDGIARYLRKKTQKMYETLKYFNHQNFEERVRSIYRTISSLTSELAGVKIDLTPQYDVADLAEILNQFSDTAEVEHIIKDMGDQRVLKKSKEGAVNLDHLSRKTLDTLWLKFGKR
jgi:hypothetical protein